MITPSRLRWGLLFITVGVMLLLNNAEALSWDYWWELLAWWPLLLIAIGIEKIFQKTKLNFVSYLSPLILIIAMIYLAVDIGGNGASKSYFTSYRWNTPADSTVKSMVALIDHGKANLYIDGDRSDLASARFERFSRKPDIKFSKNNGQGKLEIKRGFGKGRGFFVIDGKRGGRDWNFYFSEETPLKLECRGDNSDLNLNLETIPIEELKIDDPEGDIYLKIGELKDRVALEIRGEDAELRLRMPRTAGLRIYGDEYSGYMKTLGLNKTDGYYQSEGFDLLKVQVSLKLDKELKHLSINDY
jgi:hypothetical protein